MTQPVTRLRPFQSSAQPHLHQSRNSHTRFGFIPIQKHRFCASPQQTLLPKPCIINKAPAHTQKGPKKKEAKFSIIKPAQEISHTKKHTVAERETIQTNNRRIHHQNHKSKFAEVTSNRKQIVNQETNTTTKR